MPRTPPEFEEKYLDLVGLGDDFSDPPPGHKSDEETARKIRSDWPVLDRIAIYKRLFLDSARLLANIKSDWKAMSLSFNRDFKNAGEAEDWLIAIRRTMREELDRLEKK